MWRDMAMFAALLPQPGIYLGANLLTALLLNQTDRSNHPYFQYFSSNPQHYDEEQREGSLSYMATKTAPGKQASAECARSSVRKGILYANFLGTSAPHSFSAIEQKNGRTHSRPNGNPASFLIHQDKKNGFVTFRPSWPSSERCWAVSKLPRVSPPNAS